MADDNRHFVPLLEHGAASGSNPAAEVLPYTPSLQFLSGEFDLSCEDLLDGALSRWRSDGGPLVLDMTAVTFIDSTAIKVLLKALRAAPSGCLILHGVSPFVEKTLRIAGVSDLRGIHVNPCGDRNPYPTGRAYLDPEGSRDLIMRLATLRAQHDALQGVSRRTVAHTADVLARSRARRSATRRSVAAA